MSQDQVRLRVFSDERQRQTPDLGLISHPPEIVNFQLADLRDFHLSAERNFMPGLLDSLELYTGNTENT